MASPNNAFALTETRLSLAQCPPIYVSATHLDTNYLHKLEGELLDVKATLTYDISEAAIILSKVTKKARILFDLRAKGFAVKDATPEHRDEHLVASISSPSPTIRKRKRTSNSASESLQDAVVVDSSTESDAESNSHKQTIDNTDKIFTGGSHGYKLSPPQLGPSESLISVVSIAWFVDSKRLNQIQPLGPYTNYKARITERKVESEVPLPLLAGNPIEKSIKNSQSTTPTKPIPGEDILARAEEDNSTPRRNWDRFGRRKFGLNIPSANPASWEAGHDTSSKPIALHRNASTDHAAEGDSDLPDMPDWVVQGAKYACQRVTLANGPNETFISMLQKIKLARLLTNDEIGVRAYSTSIASIAAYTREIKNPREILALPGCDAKIANLFVEWSNTGRIQAVEDLEADGDLKVLRLFYDIWGVGATTAREFYYEKGWSDLDDIVENGWSTLSRVQQIGVKYYEEFKDLIPRAEVERIGAIVHEHAVRVRDEGIQSMIVGGYRRGKDASGDVDIIISHPDEGKTLNIINDIVSSLEEEEWITHTLYLSLHTSNRGQATLPFRIGGGGHGFDSLDKALVVWQDPSWPAKAGVLAENPNAKNPNIHRRVDIIISPWHTVGCAVVGWSGGTTFERDLRRYAKHAHSWKFDSSGVRDRRNGVVVDMEGYYNWKGKTGTDARARTMEEAENRVFESMNIKYRAPWERCTH